MNGKRLNTKRRTDLLSKKVVKTSNVVGIIERPVRRGEIARFGHGTIKLPAAFFCGREICESETHYGCVLRNASAATGRGTLTFRVESIDGGQKQH